MFSLSKSGRFICGIIIPFMGCSLVPAAHADQEKYDSIDFNLILEQKVGPLTDRLSELNSSLNASNANWPEINKNFLEVDKSFNDLNATIDKFMKPVNQLISAGISQASVLNVGLGFISETVTGSITEGIKWFVESRTHNIANHTALISYDSMISKYREIENAIREAEGRLDAHLSLIKLTRSVGTQRDFTQKMSLLVYHQARQSEILREMVLTAQKHLSDGHHEDLGSLRKIEELGVQVDSSIHQGQKIITFLEQSDEQKDCRNLKEGIRVIFEAESSIRKIRQSLLSLNGRSLWLAAFERSHQAELTPTLKWNFVEFLERRTEIENTEYQARIRSNEALYAAVTQAWKKCIADNNKFNFPMNSYSAYVLEKIAASRNSECWAEATNPFSPYADPYIEGISELFKAKENRIISFIDKYMAINNIETTAGDHELYDRIVDDYDTFFISLTHAQSIEKMQERTNLLLQKREQIYQLCD
jgi:hypothetical protein